MKLIADWSKWLVTIETGVIVAVGAVFTASGDLSQAAKICGTAAVASFLISIVAAALLLWTLPDIVQNLRPDEDIWLTRDSVAGGLLRVDTQSLAVVEACFFGLGLAAVAALVVTLIWA
ncbi:hypothetical protein [Streptomyces sp. enrichment culture]|uniref:hypothetical protein n=1 Tax=Streptomyces sp. enrichment culture TaxID=1795815 RepID=UPI003F54D90A